LKKKVLFRVIGSEAVGMGHIYRSLSLADELKSHDVYFSSNLESDLAIKHLSEQRRWLGATPDSDLVLQVNRIKPDMVIFDSLNTQAEMILALKKLGLKIVSFEDLGSGSSFTCLTINELFDVPALKGDNYRWGKEYFFVRDEFLNVLPRTKPKKIKNILLSFGGVDQHNLSKKIYLKICDFCKHNDIHIHIVTGPGYRDNDSLEALTKNTEGVDLTHATGVISNIMAEVDFSISSNGRTVYELAHMNVPGIVIDQHAREGTHHFACPENGFLNLGLYSLGTTENRVMETFSKIVENHELFDALYEKLEAHHFEKTQCKTIQEIQSLLN
jgi:spore coat polysaccharide biosynthesis predicted glycosyltransferase SpsG